MSTRILVTGATGKVGQQFISRLLADKDRVDSSCARSATTES